MLFKTRSASVYGIEAYLVDVEVNLSAGGTNGDFFIVGLPDTAVRESRSRVLAAIRRRRVGYCDAGAGTKNSSLAGCTGQCARSGGGRRRVGVPDANAHGSRRLHQRNAVDRSRPCPALY